MTWLSSIATPGRIGSHERSRADPGPGAGRSRRDGARWAAPPRRAPGGSARSRARRARCARAISSCTSSTVSNPNSVPSRANSVAMRQSAIVVPSGVMTRARRLTRPSRLVALPSFSPHTDVGRNTSARSAASTLNAPTAITKNRAASSASSARVDREVSDDGRRRAALGCRSCPPSRSTPAQARAPARPQAAVKCSRPPSTTTTPGRKPGVSPRSIAPCTLPRRNAERNFTPGIAAKARRRLHHRVRATSASDGRPSTTTIGRRRDRRARQPHFSTAVTGRGAVAVRTHANCVAIAGIAGRVAQHRGDVTGETRWRAGDLDHRHTEARRQPDGCANAGPGASSMRSGPSNTMPRARSRSAMVPPGARARPRRAGRRPVGRRRCRCRARPRRGVPNA